MRTSLFRTLGGAGAVIGLALLFFQFALTLPERMATGASFWGAVVFYFSFFTILTNIGVTLCHIAALTRTPALGWFRLAHVRTMFAAVIFLVMAIYHVVLAPIWDPKGGALVADIGLHYVAPLLYIAAWIVAPRNAAAHWRDLGRMMLPAVVYTGYVLLRGALTGLYPYPFLDAGQQGWIATGIATVFLTFGLAALLVAAIAADRALAGFARAPAGGDSGG